MSEDFILVSGTVKLTASLIGYRMMNHRAERPITRRNEKAIIQMHGYLDQNEEPLNGPSTHLQAQNKKLALPLMIKKRRNSRCA